MALDKGLESLLLELKSRGVPMAIASNNSRKNIDFFLARLGISGFFRKVVSFEDVKDWKPHPETYAVASQALGARPGNCVAIEDTVVGVESAKGAGLRCVALPNKFTSGHNFKVADLVANGFCDLSFGVLESLVD